jgi:hypothetical protein
MIIAIHQPNFLPWLGYFFKIAKSDYFVFLDDVQYSKNSFINRNRIRTSNEEKWLTCPVITSDGFGRPISSIQYFQPEKSMQSILGQLQANYVHTPFFKKYFDMIKCELDLSNYSLADQNIALIKAIMHDLGITTPTIRSSELHGVEGTSTERLISICNYLKGDAYIAGFGSVKYQEDELFDQAGIKLVKTTFEHPVYPQSGDGFLKNLSIIDALFNVGEITKEYLV